MAALTIRKLSDEAMRWLRRRAAVHGRSLNAELLDLLEVARADETAEAHENHPVSRTYLHARQRGVRTSSSAQSIIRADRDRR